MFRPTPLTRLKGWLIRVINPTPIYPVGLNNLDMSKLGSLSFSPNASDQFNQLIFTLFKGAPSNWITNFIDELEGDIKHSPRRWDVASATLPAELSSSVGVDIQWVLWYRFGGVQIINIPACVHDDKAGVGYLAHPMPKTVVKAAKVARYDNSDNPVSWRWRLYHSKNN